MTDLLSIRKNSIEVTLMSMMLLVNSKSDDQNQMNNCRINDLPR